MFLEPISWRGGGQELYPRRPRSSQLPATGSTGTGMSRGFQSKEEFEE